MFSYYTFDFGMDIMHFGMVLGALSLCTVVEAHISYSIFNTMSKLIIQSGISVFRHEGGCLHNSD